MTFAERIEAEIEKDRAYHEEHGWEQTPRRKGGHTIGDFIRATLGVKDEAEMPVFFEGYVAYLRSLPEPDPGTRADPEGVARSNIGWCFGEGMPPERIAMWNRVCDAAHPVFGAG